MRLHEEEPNSRTRPARQIRKDSSGSGRRPFDDELEILMGCEVKGVRRLKTIMAEVNGELGGDGR